MLSFEDLPRDNEEARDKFVSNLDEVQSQAYEAYRKLGRKAWEHDEERQRNKRIEAIAKRNAKLANRDSLTGLPNRRALLEKMADFDSKHRGVLFLDFDRFSEINNAFGHQKGDEFLQKVTVDLLKDLRSTDLVYFMLARYGGDELVVLLDLTPTPNDEKNRINISSNEEERLQEVVGRVNESFGTFMQQHPELVDLGVDLSIGAMVWPLGTSGKEILVQADQAMYQQKYGQN